ncbi:MAG: AAA family ATPase [Candidatus Rokuibacteriota bacterium]
MATTDLLLIGRATELRRLQENVAKGRHSLLVGKVGLGKSHLLRVLTRELPRSIYLDQVRPLRLSLLDLCQALHTRRDLTLTAPDAPWPDALKKLQRLNIRELTEVIARSLHDKGYVLILDQLEGLTPTTAPTMERLLAEALVLGAASQLKPALQKVWWAFDRIDLQPLGRDEARELLWALADPGQIADPAMFEAKVLAQADGNPYALVEMVRQVAGERQVGLQAIRDLHHGAGVRYLDITPVLLLLGAVIVAARFVALGLNDPDLYIIAGSLGAVFFVARYFLYRGLRRRG